MSTATSFIFIGDTSGGEVVITGSGGPAFDVRSTAGSNPIIFQNLTIEGQAGIKSSVGLLLMDVEFRSITGTALELVSGIHEARRLAFGPSVTDGIRLAAGALISLDRGWWDGVTGTGLVADGEAHLFNVEMVNGGSAIVTGPTGVLDVRFATIADNSLGIDNAAGAAATVGQSIVWSNSGGDIVSVDCAGVSWSDIGSVDCTGAGNNLSINPLFVDPAGGDYHLQAGSPVLDHGPDPSTYDGNPVSDLDGGPRLRDHDGDGLARSDCGTYERENTALPSGEVENLRWIDVNTLVWDSEPSAVEYHVYRNDLATLSYANFGTCRDDLDGDRTDLLLGDPSVPGGGQGYVYLITTEESFGDEGTLGLATGAERSNFIPCP